jgi:hypothetical protein
VVRLPRMHPHMLRHTFVTTMLDAGVDLRDVQIAARHADPRTTMRYDRARKNLDRHPNQATQFERILHRLVCSRSNLGRARPRVHHAGLGMAAFFQNDLRHSQLGHARISGLC